MDFEIKSEENDNIFKDYILRLFDLAYQNERITNNKVTFKTNKESELVKLFINLATKIAFCNKIFDFCEKKIFSMKI
tara:strand:+ start:135 stop:365 length:231 start_codon:yes stop_codon:yes gene_type:complete